MRVCEEQKQKIHYTYNRKYGFLSTHTGFIIMVETEYSEAGGNFPEIFSHF